MILFIIKRIFNGLLALVTVVIIISALIYSAPVDPARLTFGQNMDKESLDLKRKQLGLDLPFKQQLVLYLKDISPISTKANVDLSNLPYKYLTLIQFNKSSLIAKLPYFRRSFQTNELCINMIKEVVPNTLILATCAILLASLIGIFFGLIAALNKDTMVDGFLMAFSTLGYSVPSYVSAIFLSIVFGYLLGDLTGLNMQGSILELNDLGDEEIRLRNLILPSIALGVRPVAVIMQLTRSAMLEVLSQNYIKTALAKGLSFGKVIWRHALKNAMNPVATSISGWFASLLSGAFFVENVFNFNGLGQLTVNALLLYDIPLLLSCLILTACIFILINILMDFVYLKLDPKTKMN